MSEYLSLQEGLRFRHRWRLTGARCEEGQVLIFGAVTRPFPVVGEGNRESRGNMGTILASTILLRWVDVLPGMDCANTLAQASFTQSWANY